MDLIVEETARGWITGRSYEALRMRLERKKEGNNWINMGERGEAISLFFFSSLEPKMKARDIMGDIWRDHGKSFSKTDSSYKFKQ